MLSLFLKLIQKPNLSLMLTVPSLVVKNPKPSVMSMNVPWLLKTFGELETVQKDINLSIVTPSMVIAHAPLKPNLVTISSLLSKTISYTKILMVMVLLT
jgi:uncharacterized protein (UPF0264 family)